MIARACTLAVLLGVAGLPACAPSHHALQGPVDRDLARRLEADLPAASLEPMAASAIDARLASPLDRDAAVRIALATSPRLRVVLAGLGIAGSQLAVSVGAVDVSASLRFVAGTTDWDVTATQDLLGLLAASQQRGIGRSALAAARADATAAALRLVAAVETAFDDVVAAGASAELARTAALAADAAATLRERMFAAGNTTVLAVARERDAREQTRIAVTRADGRLAAARETLAGLLGLTTAQSHALAVTARLPSLPAAAPALDDLESRAVAASLALIADRARSEVASAQASRERLSGVLPRIGVGVSIARDHEDGAIGVGPAVSLGLPLFDWNSRGRARANAEQHVAEASVDASAIETRTAARVARARALATYREAVELRDVVLPLRQQILDETVKHYNAMDADPFALVLARRDLADAADQLVDATRRYWNQMAEVAALERGVVPEATREPIR